LTRPRSEKRRLWLIPGLLVASATAVALPAVPASPTPDHRASEVAEPPQILAVRYGRFSPDGAEQSYTAIRVKTRDPNGQVIGLGGGIVGSNKGWHADGGCDLGGRRIGGATTWTVPMRLSRGRHRLSITADSSSCNKRNVIESTEATFGLTVRKPGG
jgi:hypothetical protein